ncbi:hypothetical protein [Streptomyces sp. TLI_185]|uniref:SCO2102 family sporulation regulator n=1 Tax=Streptomyces sp. TLI_185 TaxID=2485151 RepID=UPI000F4F754D|nr:hypothetical protein [Streptomyces sp. TLI_185]RPF32855.1 hypothetical protein EDD92_2750 [Streptomyces sp. TLI_185]
MGWTVLYIAFGIVALWLLGEVLLQYKARLRWRLLAFAGFLGVVLGVLIPSVIVIGLGAAAFAVGQTYVTLSFRRGFASGWAVSRTGIGGVSKRRRGEPDHQDPTLEVSDLEPGDGGHDDQGVYNRESVSYGNEDDYDRDDVFTPARSSQPAPAESTAVYEPQPLPDDTGSYGIYSDPAYAAADASYANTGQSQDQYATAAQGADQSYGYDYSGYNQQQYGYDTTGQQQYAAYSDPYIGTQTYGGGYDAYGQYGQQGYGQDQYATGTYDGQTPSGGVWVPQQRTDEAYGGELPQEQPYPYQDNGQGQGQGQAQGNGYDEQYRF